MEENKKVIIKAGVAAFVIIVLLICLVVLALSRRGGGPGGNQGEATPVPTLNPGIPQFTIDAQDPSNWPTHIDHRFFFQIDYPTGWKIVDPLEGSPQEAIGWEAPDGSQFQLSYERNTTRSLTDYLRRLDFERSTELNGKPSVEVSSSVTFDMNGQQAVQRSETWIEEELNVIVVYLSIVEEQVRPVNYIFSFTIIPQESTEPDMTEVFQNYLNMIGSFVYKPYRFVVRGRIVTGEEALVDWCKNGYYIEFDGGINSTSNNYIFLRTIGETGHPPFRDSRYLNQNVKIDGIYQPDKELCFDLTCECEDFLIIENITPLASP